MKKILILLTALTFANQAFAADMKVFTTTIKDHKFAPDVLEVPSGEKFKLVVKNEDKTAEEFESHDLRKEKIIAGGKEITMIISPLQKGEYKFEGEFHPKTAQGKLIAK